MNRKLNRSRISMQASLVAGLLAGGVLGIAAPAHSSEYQLTALTTDDNANLTSLGFPAAANVDSNLVNPGHFIRPDNPILGLGQQYRGVDALQRGWGAVSSRDASRGFHRSAKWVIARLHVCSDRPSVQ